ncbi:MAG: bifunctional phosphopantothenoylcysteine decarboxylase/phosphopantothenate--cysteine ligase CoaBC [Verrucomicrobiae bacterium]|nr:bifunctional phosphopantothenoylcysteine decarboxylase/phosphopantothenate--cysteine ligase CoaBC [Verrucomicrobiae bacterium]
MSPSKILFKLTGSIACYKACNLISRWVQDGHEVQVVASQAALKFVGASTFEGLTGKPVYHDLYESGKQMAHIDLVKWADLTVMCPATANTINRLAQGLGDDLIGSLFLAHDFKKPYFVVPAMNTAMYRHPATRASLQKLEDWGIRILPTAEGRLACGDIGEGKLLEPDDIASMVEHALARPAKSGGRKLRFLITSGGTEEPIDGVRSISNFSSGRTGAEFADYLYTQGHEVTLLRAKRAARAKKPVSEYTFVSFHDLDRNLRELLSGHHFDCVIHLAAVSDYSVDHLLINGEKVLPGGDTKFSSDQEITLNLARNYKIVDRISSYSRNGNLLVVSFKLTNHASEAEREQAVLHLLEHSLADIVVQNDLSEVDALSGAHAAALYVGNRLVKRVGNKSELIQAVENLILESDKIKKSSHAALS